MPHRISRRQVFRMVAAGTITGASSYALLIEPSELTVENVKVKTNLPTGLRIGALSDFHLADHISQQRVEAAVRQMQRLSPDVILLLGDYSTAMHTESVIQRNVELALEILGTLDAPLGVYAILGNHDVSRGLDDIATIIHRHGPVPLIDTGVVLSTHGEKFAIVGLADALQMKPDPFGALGIVPKGVPYLGLVHEPDAASKLLPQASLVLSGHSHGGQVRLPGIGAPVLPQLGKRLPWGLRRDSNTLVYTSRGVGMVPPRIRINCRPELTLITIVNSGGRAPMAPLV
ncbi:MAG TPA: metallophosphoesterase [Nitrolancea sp.]|nr:metallophosphoesterase [Nitrolancea sp.]